MVAQDDGPRWHGLPVRHMALISMSVQNAAAAITMHYSRVIPGYEDNRYFTSTAVFLSELMKFICALIVVRANHIGEARKDASAQLVVGDPSWTSTINTLVTRDSWKLIIPAALYTMQNNLQYVAISNLDAATFQVTYQLKLLTTAVFSVIILRKQLSMTKWGALVLLTFGVALVSMPTSQSAASTSIDASTMNRHLGLVAVLIACCLSGLAGVYFEKVLKGSNLSLWNLNVQLSFFAMFPALLLGVGVKDGVAVLQYGFFYGYNYAVWLSIVVQALGGFLVAICVFYTDNISKNFATSIAIIISAIASVFLFGFIISTNFYLGSVAVVAATYIYAKADNVKQVEDDLTSSMTERDPESLMELESPMLRNRDSWDSQMQESLGK